MLQHTCHESLGGPTDSFCALQPTPDLTSTFLGGVRNLLWVRGAERLYDQDRRPGRLPYPVSNEAAMPAGMPEFATSTRLTEMIFLGSVMRPGEAPECWAVDIVSFLTLASMPLVGGYYLAPVVINLREFPRV